MDVPDRPERADGLCCANGGQRQAWEPEMSPAVAPVDTAQQSQEALLLHSALMQISEDKREVLVLSRFQDLKYEEIAQLLGCEVAR